MTPQELKESIIRSAMQGKLVHQLDSDGTSDALINKISIEQSMLIKAKKSRASKADIITEEDLPFDIPSSWTWIRFGNLVSYNMGKTPPRAESQWWGKGVPWVSIADMPESGHILTTKESVTHEAINDKFSGRISKAGTLLMSFKLTVGRVSILDIDAVHNEAIISIYPYADEDEVIKKYLFAILPYVAQSGDSKNAIKGKTLNDTSISNLLIPLPPIAEQKRIIAKLEELLPLIDRYETAWNKLEEFNKRFPMDMQKSILQMAIQGKLVPQLPEEGTGEELFLQIQAKKQALIKTGTIKKEKPLPEIADDEIPFDIPDTWKWVRLGSLIHIESGKGLTTAQMKPGSIPVYGGNGITGYHNESLLHEETVVIGRVGFYCGSVHITEKECWVTDNAFITTYPQGCIDRAFLVHMLRHMDLGQNNNATAQPVVSGKKIYPMLFPLPPLAEQKRIVAKLEEILPLCERLK